MLFSQGYFFSIKKNAAINEGPGKTSLNYSKYI